MPSSRPKRLRAAERQDRVRTRRKRAMPGNGRDKEGKRQACMTSATPAAAAAADETDFLAKREAGELHPGTGD